MVNIAELNWGFTEIFYLIIIFIVGFLFTFILLPYLIKILKFKGYVGVDIHKNSRPEVAESGGLIIILGLSLTSFLSLLFFPNLTNEIIVFILTIIISGIIGFIDDRIKLRSIYKIIFTIFTGSIIFFANLFNYIEVVSPSVPFLGETRLTLIYPIITPIIVAVFANTSNMLEGYNGEGSGTSLIALFFLFICALIWNSAEAIIFIISGIAILIPFYIYNKFPSKIFPGDIGTLSIGSLFACIALLGSLEVAVFCALLLFIMNGFYVISSLRGFFESSEIQEKKHDIILLADDRIKASDQKDAALSLPRLILAKGPLTEPELVKNFYIISIICGFVSVLATLLLQWTLERITLPLFFLVLLIFLIPILTLLYFFPRIRGIILLIGILLGIIIICLILIDNLIMKYFEENIDLLIIIIPSNILFSLILITPGLVLWYYFALKYFWIQIKKIEK